MRKIYCLKCKKHNGNKNPKVTRAFNGRIMFSPVCAVCNKKKMNLLKKQEAWELVSLLGGIPILCPSLI